MLSVSIINQLCLVSIMDDKNICAVYKYFFSILFILLFQTYNVSGQQMQFPGQQQPMQPQSQQQQPMQPQSQQQFQPQSQQQFQPQSQQQFPPQSQQQFQQQNPRDCSQLIQNAMIEYRRCMDYTYQRLFELRYDQLNTGNVMQKCSTSPYADCREMTERRLGGCLDFTQREALEANFQMVEAGIRYWCSDYSIRLTEFYGKRGPDCYFQQQSILRSCELEYPVINVFLRSYDSSYCRTLSSVINCLQTVYEKCLLHEDPTVIRGFYEAMWRSTPCFTVEQQYLLSIATQSTVHYHLSAILLILFMIHLLTNIK